MITEAELQVVLETIQKELADAKIIINKNNCSFDNIWLNRERE